MGSQTPEDVETPAYLILRSYMEPQAAKDVEARASSMCVSGMGVRTSEDVETLDYLTKSRILEVREAVLKNEFV